MPLEDLHDLKLDLSRLLDSSGWRAICSVVQGQIRARRAALIESAVSSMDDCFRIARLQGELAGLQAVRVLPEALIDELAFELEHRKSKEGLDNAG